MNYSLMLMALSPYHSPQGFNATAPPSFMCLAISSLRRVESSRNPPPAQMGGKCVGPNGNELAIAPLDLFLAMLSSHRKKGTQSGSIQSAIHLPHVGVGPALE